jgi:hypothetical protein
VRGSENISKRVLIHVGAFNVGLVMRKMTGTGTPRGAQDRPAEVIQLIAQFTFWLNLLRALLQSPMRVTRGRFVTPFVGDPSPNSGGTSSENPFRHGLLG